MSRVPKKASLSNFSNILRKSIANAFVFYCDEKHSDTWVPVSWVPVMFVVTYFWVVVVKNGCGYLDHETLKSAASQASELIK